MYDVHTYKPQSVHTNIRTYEHTYSPRSQSANAESVAKRAGGKVRERELSMCTYIPGKLTSLPTSNQIGVISLRFCPFTLFRNQSTGRRETAAMRRFTVSMGSLAVLVKLKETAAADDGGEADDVDDAL